jgi:hypothetical protein
MPETNDKSAPLQSALARRFYPQVESMGLIRDDRQQPKITCFRRKTSTAVQIFAILWAKRGRPGFWVQFTEAPLEGIDYGGGHLAAEDIFPGNFALLRGWLVPRRGQIWFRFDQPLWRRLLLRQRDDPNPLVERLLDLFPEIIAWWNDKTKREHLRILPPIPPRPIPDHAPVSGSPVKPSWLQLLFARTQVWTAGLLGVAVCLDLAVAIQAPDLPQMLVLVFVGAIGGFLVSWVLFKVLWHARIWINGGPFRKGDLVQVLAGTHAGKIAALYEEWPARSQVRIDLGEQEWTEVKDVFTYVQLCRVKATQVAPVPPHPGPLPQGEGESLAG